MPFLAGQPRPFNAGRRAGVPNKINRAVRERIAKLNCDPIAALVDIANDPQTPLEWRARILMELASYVYPKPRGQRDESEANQQVLQVNIVYASTKPVVDAAKSVVSLLEAAEDKLN
jgi:hypothetical protein